MISIFLFSESSIRFLIFPASSVFFVRTVVRTVTGPAVGVGPVGPVGGVGLLAHSAVLTPCCDAEWEGKSQGGEEEEEEEEDEEGEGEEREEEREEG